jgi:methyltransferase (TIGR00027 family)
MMGGRLDAGQPSATAQGVAVRRAAHQLLETPPVFADPFALKVIGAEAAAELEQTLEEQQNAWNRAMRAFMAARSRHAEARLASAYAAGVRQYVVLGAGLDTFLLRNPHADLRVFEVDHPSTQAWKRARLAELGLEPREGTVFAPVDFQSQALPERLAAAGLDAGRPTFFSWLGVVMYLPDDAAFRTLAFIASLPARSEVVFDFTVPPEQMSLASQFAAARLAQGVAALGETFKSAFDPAELVRRLRGAGFSDAETLGADELNALHFAGRSDDFRVRGAGRMACARV